MTKGDSPMHMIMRYLNIGAKGQIFCIDKYVF